MERGGECFSLVPQGIFLKMVVIKQNSGLFPPFFFSPVIPQYLHLAQ